MSVSEDFKYREHIIAILMGRILKVIDISKEEGYNKILELDFDKGWVIQPQKWTLEEFRELKEKERVMFK